VVQATRYFPSGNVWLNNITNGSLDSESPNIINWLASNGGWGNGNKFQVDFSFNILYATASTPYAPLVRDSGYYTPDCDANATSFPLPTGGAIEGQTNYTCDTTNNDCHLLVVDEINKVLWESYQTTLDSTGSLHSLCVIKWDLCRVYPASQRGDQCTSTDAAGLPIAQLLFTADELAAGTIDHAIRYILPNARIREGVYVHPASHAGGPTATGTAPIYGSRLRLKSTFDGSSFSTGAQVVIQALKTYGMILADGGNILLTAANEAFTTHKYNETNFTSQSLFGINVTDFDVVDGGNRITLNDSCVLNVFSGPAC